MAPNRHLSAAWIDRMCPDVVITESTYATTVQPTKRLRERSFVQQVKQCVDGGGKVRTEACIKRCVCVIIALVIHQNPHNTFVVAPCSTAIDSTQVLIPVFALGRAQELCILLDSFWERMGMKVPIYFSAGLAAKANFHYRTFINWASATLRDCATEGRRNMFDFARIKEFDK